MKYLNSQACALYNVTEKDYIDWCTKHNKPAYKQSTKTEFFDKLSCGKLVKDSTTNTLLVKRPKKNKGGLINAANSIKNLHKK